jgi:hypothetical protein
MSQHLVYICADASTTNVVTKEFKLKALQNMTIGRLSQIHVLAKPTEPQFAYGGYKNAIEAFVTATITKRKLLTSADEYKLPKDYIPSVPLPLPQLICRFKSSLTEAQIKKIIEKWQGSIVSPVDGAHGPTYEIMEPTWNMVFTSLPQLAQSQCIRIDKRAQIEELVLLRPVYQFIDGFLATNTYPYKKEHFKLSDESKGAEKYLGKAVELRSESAFWRSGYGKTKLQKVAWDEDVAEGRKVDDQEEEDLTPHIDTERQIGNSVFVAKPSPLPSSTSYGAPTAVPYLGGLVFPYFPGMLLYDLPGIRDLIGRLVFRCLGDETTSAREAYKVLRSKLGSTMNTPQGLIVGHVLKGIELSLDSQTQLFLLFDKTVYLGFCLLGSEFSVWAHGAWREARSADELREDLKVVTTSDQARENLVEVLKGLNTGIETAFLDDLEVSMISTGSGLLRVLGQLEAAGEIEDGKRAEIISLYGRCNLPAAYKVISPNNIEWAIRQLTVFAEEEFNDDCPIFVPATTWSDCNNKAYRVLASFGPRSFSLRNASGENIRMLSAKDPAAKRYKFLFPADQGKREPYPFIVYTKTIKECIKDWNAVISSGEVRMDFTERAGGIRGNKFYGKDKGTLLKAFSDAIEAGKFVKDKKEEKKAGKGKAKDTSDEGPVSDDFLDGLL